MADRFTDLIPVVPYEDIRAGHDFLVDVLGFESAGIVEDGDGNVVHGEVRVGDRRIWLHAAAGGLTTPRSSDVQTGGIVVHVADVDAHFARVKAAGADITRSRPTRTTASASTASATPKATAGTSPRRSRADARRSARWRREWDSNPR